MKKLVYTAAVVAAVFASAQANAATGNVQFDGTVAGTCVINVSNAGVLGVSTDFSTLGSSQAGGTPGSATVQTTDSSFKISLDTPSAWTSAPASGNANVAFSSAYSSTGSTTASNVEGSTMTPLNAGSHNVTINLTAAKTVSGETFAPGSYQAQVVLRCEP